MKIFLLCALLASSPGAADSQTDAQSPRPLFEINRQISEIFQREAKATTTQERAAATFDMTVLYREILRDPRFVTSNSLQEYRAKLWSRMTRIKKDIQSKMRRANKSDGSAADLDDAQWAAVAETTRSLGDQFALVGAALGGPAGLLSQVGAAGGGAVPPDYGPALVDLIQRTIQPEFWDVYGGPGTIVYYRPLHCLVVRATSDVHYRLGGTLAPCAPPGSKFGSGNASDRPASRAGEKDRWPEGVLLVRVCPAHGKFGLVTDDGNVIRAEGDRVYQRSDTTSPSQARHLSHCKCIEPRIRY